MANIKKYNGSTWENTTARKYETKSEIIIPPTTIYADGTAATVSLKGNTVQNGTPTPSNPVDVVGVGERTENLFNTFDIVGQVPSTGNGALVSYNGSTTSFIPINSGNVVVTKPEGILIYLMLYAANGDYIGYDIANAGTTINGSNISGYENAKLARLRIDRTSGLDDIQIMFNSGSTAKPYEPYGYKIPISSGGVTTNIYLGSTQTVRQIKKVVFDGTENWQGADNTTSKYLANIVDYKASSEITCMSTHYSGTNNIVSGDLIPNNSACFYNAVYPRCLYLKGSEPITLANFKAYLAQQYAAGTPVTVWYVLAQPTTGIVNEPIRKIGDYADTVSGITIPTITGKDTFDVQTTLKPSEVSLSYTGWHDATVQEWDGSQWNE